MLLVLTCLDFLSGIFCGVTFVSNFLMIAGNGIGNRSGIGNGNGIGSGIGISNGIGNGNGIGIGNGNGEMVVIYSANSA